MFLYLHKHESRRLGFGRCVILLWSAGLAGFRGGFLRRLALRHNLLHVLHLNLVQFVLARQFQSRLLHNLALRDFLCLFDVVNVADDFDVGIFLRLSADLEL